MSEAVPGTYIDLHYINKEVVAQQPKKSSFQEAVNNAVEVGTSYIFNQGKAFRKIPVQVIS